MNNRCSSIPSFAELILVFSVSLGSAGCFSSVPAVAQDWAIAPEGSGPFFVMSAKTEAKDTNYSGIVEMEVMFNERDDEGKRFGFNIFFEVIDSRKFRDVEEVCIEDKCIPVYESREFNDGEEEQIRTNPNLDNMVRISESGRFDVISVVDDKGNKKTAKIPKNIRLAAEEIVKVARKAKNYEHAPDIPLGGEVNQLVTSLMKGVTYARIPESSERYDTYKRFWASENTKYVTVAKHPYRNAKDVYRLVDINNQSEEEYYTTGWEMPAKSAYQNSWRISPDERLIIHIEKEIICFVVRRNK